jgi:hypothetical protein
MSPDRNKQNPAAPKMLGSTGAVGADLGFGTQLALERDCTRSGLPKQFPLAVLLLMRRHGLPLRRAMLVAALAGFREMA